MTMKESNEQSHTFINSPVSLTEKNTLQIDQIALNNERINYRDKFTRVSAELERRTERFNQVIDLCSRVLGSIKSENDNYSSTYVHKIGYANAKIEDML